jgi:hypothetical protein
VLGAPQVQLARGPPGGREAERAGEDLGPSQVGFLELQPGEIADLDDRVDGPARVLAGQGALLAVQAGVRVVLVDH